MKGLVDGLSSIAVFFYSYSFTSKFQIKFFKRLIFSMVRHIWLNRIKKTFKLQRKEWSNNKIRKGCLSSLNKHIKVSTPASHQLNAKPTINFSDIKKADKSIKNSVGIDEFLPTKLLN